MKLSRREWLIGSGAFAMSAPAFAPAPALAVLAQGDKLIPNTRGGYRFLPGVPFLSLAALPSDGFEIVRATLRRPRPLSEGLTAIEKYLPEVGRPLHALCGLELRSGHQTTRAEFAAFNSAYIERMRMAGLLVGDSVPMTRTNVAMAGMGEHQIYAFSYTVPLSRSEPKPSPTFVVAAVAEVRNLASRPEVVAAGDTSLEGLRQKTAFVLEELEGRLRLLGLRLGDVTGTALYTVYDIHPLMASLILPKLSEAARIGVQWYHAQPPVVGSEIEVDVRATRMELTINI
ncbi:hypothetical protein LuPra_01749 [Luteitalea pratensis]|uniref:RidA family protein n=2 Tax=Luteitalea pratensis TaxID=1855912 RepID=A0A143PKD5_LUTPR|nr:hypothetical protein LuPra_01749 [Luteitalea pratensis]